MLLLLFFVSPLKSGWLVDQKQILLCRSFLSYPIANDDDDVFCFFKWSLKWLACCCCCSFSFSFLTFFFLFSFWFRYGNNFLCLMNGWLVGWLVGWNEKKTRKKISFPFNFNFYFYFSLKPYRVFSLCSSTFDSFTFISIKFFCCCIFFCCYNNTENWWQKLLLLLKWW